VVQFEFDPRKSAINKAKHGIDFIEAQALWKSKHVRLHAKEALEQRYLVIGKIDGHHWSAIITYRGATIRIISVRKSNAAETDTYAKIAG
jgi:uncharacterized DUF497 family protein